MLENGTIEYDFYYREGESLVHPALDRLVFLLAPTGLRIHWLTDGVYDRTELEADNVTEEPRNRRGAEALPLNRDSWNRLALTLKDDMVLLFLNGQLIYERPVESTNQRTFGLFHYKDQSEARVRNVTWRGDWPRQLPALAEQELVNQESLVLEDQLVDLPAVFTHDFAKQGFPTEKFTAVQGNLNENFQPMSDGLHVTGIGNSGYRDIMFTPRLTIRGDFDIIATYEQLLTEAVPEGSASLYLQTLLGEGTECIVMRRQSRPKVGPDLQFHQTAVVRYEGANVQRKYSRSVSSETLAGRLRLARRGKMVYFLMAEGDSPNYSLLNREEVSDADVLENGLRIMTQTHREGRVSAVWTSLTIRAAELNGLAIQNISE
jgi:hypothetical protein